MYKVILDPHNKYCSKRNNIRRRFYLGQAIGNGFPVRKNVTLNIYCLLFCESEEKQNLEFSLKP